jgi:hypothetical protein
MVSKEHVLCQHTSKHSISSRLQETICVVSEKVVFEEGEEILRELAGIEVSAKQLQRVSEEHGEALEKAKAEADKSPKPSPPSLQLKHPEETVYCMCDGGMVFIREEGWKEMKVGRAFPQSSCVAIQQNRKQIIQSQYTCHLGDHTSFLAKWEPELEHYKNKVFIADGAKWIWNYVSDAYPDAVQILDFFHAVEKIAAFAKLQYSDLTERAKWLELQKEQLKDNGVEKMINLLGKMKAANKEAANARQEVLQYYENNKERMRYKTYLEKGYLIGSGAIEAAHRNVIQQRLKLSGQRWSVSGAQSIANLRAAKKSNQWDKVVNCIKAVA